MANIMTTRRAVLGGAFAAAAHAAYGDEAALSFLVLGDWGDPETGGQQRVADAMGRVASELSSAFVISTGDNFYHGGVRSVRDPQWRETFENVYAAPALQTPWYVVLGNHDYEGSEEAQVDYTRISARWRMPGRYWRQDFADAGAAIFFLDTNQFVRRPLVPEGVPGHQSAGEAQWAWLESELAASRAAWKFVVGHHPVLSSGQHGATPVLQERLQPLLERYGVQAYFNGHDHDLEHLRAGGVNYICSGAGSAARSVQPNADSLFALSHMGFAGCRLSRATLQLNFYDDAGASVYAAAIERA